MSGGAGMMTRTDRIDERTARAVASFLDLPLDDIAEGRRLPLMWHLFYFLAYPSQSQIGTDGHPSVGEATPLGTRRMFAGGRVVSQPGLRIGDSVTAVTDIAADTTRQGSSGVLRFVTHRTSFQPSTGAPALVDERDIVYIPLASSPPSPPEPVQPDGATSVPQEALSADTHRSVGVDPTLLFRFSALTYNAHRIHYDREYARQVEGYPGLVVHGPLQAVLMAGLAEEQWRGSSPSRFTYRLVAPLFEHEGLFVSATTSGGSVTTTVMDGTGRVTAKGSLEPVDVGTIPD